MELIAWIAGAQLHKRCNFEDNACIADGVMKVVDIQLHGRCNSKAILSRRASFQCLTLGSRKLNYKRAHYTTFLMKLHEKLDSSVTRWNDIIIDIFNDNVHI